MKWIEIVSRFVVCFIWIEMWRSSSVIKVLNIKSKKLNFYEKGSPRIHGENVLADEIVILTKKGGCL